MIRNPQVTIYSRDVPKTLAFYQNLGFEEAFRYPDDGPIIHIELLLDGFNLGIVDIAMAAQQHSFEVNLTGRGIELVFWTDDTDALFASLATNGAPVISEPHDWLDDLRVAWIADPDGNPIQVVSRRW